MKPATVAKKLGIYLPAAPEEFRESEISREEFTALLESPPEWLTQLRNEGPHPRLVVAQKLGVSTSGLARAGAPDVMTTSEIKALLVEMPKWLVEERSVHAAVNEENARIKTERSAKAARK
ncbi:DUF5997 family protein [Salinibacterium sp. M195]|uniref:DUF5997 family protein n=1 Tax=Salinibacterium sp. M195 TaxID=2583374 RepID=UPI001C629B85|nr:DUF5997 family protein [Salinibacterium sp. M195]